MKAWRRKGGLGKPSYQVVLYSDGGAGVFWTFTEEPPFWAFQFASASSGPWSADGFVGGSQTSYSSLPPGLWYRIFASTDPSGSPAFQIGPFSNPVLVP
jgi:hypothetical protein